MSADSADIQLLPLDQHRAVVNNCAWGLALLANISYPATFHSRAMPLELSSVFCRQEAMDKQTEVPLYTQVWQEYFSQLQDTTNAPLCHIHLSICLWIMDPHPRALKNNTSHGNEVLPQYTTHFTQRPFYQRGSPCQDPAGNWTTRRPDDRKETQTAVVWSCLPNIGSGQNHLARHSERGKKTRQTEEEWEDNTREWTGLEFGRS